MTRVRISFLYVAIGLMCVMASALAMNAMQYQFGAFDLSPLIDSGWRVLQRQVPNRDFICTFPPIVYLPTALAFKAFGVKWASLELIGSLFPIALILAGLRVVMLLRPQQPEAATRLLALVFACLQLVLLLILSHPWHSSWTEASALYTDLTTFAILSAHHSRFSRTELIAHLSFGWTLLLLGKPNTGLPTLVFSILCLVSLRNWSALIAGAIVSFSLASTALYFVGTSLSTTLHQYSLLTSRIWGLGVLLTKDTAHTGRQKWLVYGVAILCLTWIMRQTLKRGDRLPLWLRLLAWGCAVTTLCGVVTNAEFTIIDVPCAVLGATFLLISLQHIELMPLRMMQCIVTVLVLIAISYCLLRSRMRSAGPWAGDPCRTIIRDDSFFGHFHSCPAMFSVLQQADQVVAEHRGEPIFFGPRLEFLYAREHIQSPEKLPLWWHPGTSYPLRDVQPIKNAFEETRFSVLVFVHDDPASVPPHIFDDLDQKYVLAPNQVSPNLRKLTSDRYAQIDVYVRKPGA